MKSKTHPPPGEPEVRPSEFEDILISRVRSRIASRSLTLIDISRGAGVSYAWLCSLLYSKKRRSLTFDRMLRLWLYLVNTCSKN